MIGWFEFEIKIFGHYVIRPKNKYLSKCQGNRIDFKIKKETREREVVFLYLMMRLIFM